MKFPDFIGIGVQKSGTSWLYRQLLLHPQVFIPPHRKEIHYFDTYFKRGVKWYKNFFQQADSESVCGEITPDYIYFEEVAERVYSTCPKAKFILILRNPVERAHSHYCMIFQSGEGQKFRDFDDFMTNHPHGFARGMYASQIKRWLKFFDLSQFLILVSENMSHDDDNLERTFESISNFLNIDSTLFNYNQAWKRVGQRRAPPKFALIGSLAQKLRLLLRALNMDFIAHALKKIGITRQILGESNSSIPPLSNRERNKWMARYRSEIAELEELLGRSFDDWY